MFFLILRNFEVVFFENVRFYVRFMSFMSGCFLFFMAKKTPSRGLGERMESFIIVCGAVAILFIAPGFF